MTWAQHRKFIYLGTIAVIFIAIAVWIFVAYFYKAPTCFDGKMNGDEQGIDCGGSCQLLCRAQYAPLTVLWSRFSKVNDGVYNVLAYIENPNISAASYNLNYTFKLYDSRGVLLKERSGKTFAPPNKLLAVFEADMLTGNQVPTRVDFSFTSAAVWVKQESKETGLSVSQSVLSREDTAPRLTTTVTNKTINIINQIEAIAIAYNGEGNTVAFSRTIIDSLNGKEAREISFNWPKPFVEPAARTEVILKILK